MAQRHILLTNQILTKGANIVNRGWHYTGYIRMAGGGGLHFADQTFAILINVIFFKGSNIFAALVA